MKAEEFFRTTSYWRAWSQVPDVTADIAYALAAVESSDRSVLDVPCGRGRLLKALRHRRSDLALFGLDVNGHMIAEARRLVPAARAAVASVYAIPFRHRAFDVVICHESFMHFDDPAAAMSELTRVAHRAVYLSVTTRRQLNTLLRRLRLLGSSSVPHWSYDLEDLEPFLSRDEFEWKVVGAFLVGRKALRLSHGTYLRLHTLVGRRLPQRLLRHFGQTLFLYGIRRQMPCRGHRAELAGRAR
jgi:SAM-dependent methyltransferase